MRTGFIGLGAMGSSMARNLHRAGLLKGVWNRTAARAQQLAAELGCAAPATAALLARESEVLVMCVSADQDVLALVASVAPELQPGSIVIDCTTAGADTARTAAAQLAARSVGFLDAPVSGGVGGAPRGPLAIMVGRDTPRQQLGPAGGHAIGPTRQH